MFSSFPFSLSELNHSARDTFFRGKVNLVETFDAAEKSGNQNYKGLVDFSLKAADEKTMGKLGIDQPEDLFLLLAQAHPPMPRLPDATTQNMVANLSSCLPRLDACAF